MWEVDPLICPHGVERIVELCFDDPSPDYDTESVYLSSVALAQEDDLRERPRLPRRSVAKTGLREVKSLTRNWYRIGVDCHRSRLMARLDHHDPVCEASIAPQSSFSYGLLRSRGLYVAVLSSFMKSMKTLSRYT